MTEDLTKLAREALELSGKASPYDQRLRNALIKLSIARKGLAYYANLPDSYCWSDDDRDEARLVLAEIDDD